MAEVGAVAEDGLVGQETDTVDLLVPMSVDEVDGSGQEEPIAHRTTLATEADGATETVHVPVPMSVDGDSMYTSPSAHCTTLATGIALTEVKHVPNVFPQESLHQTFPMMQVVVEEGDATEVKFDSLSDASTIALLAPLLHSLAAPVSTPISTDPSVPADATDSGSVALEAKHVPRAFPQERRH